MLPSPCTIEYQNLIPSSLAPGVHYASHKSAEQYAKNDRLIERQMIYEHCAHVYTHCQVFESFHQNYKSAWPSKFNFSLILTLEIEGIGWIWKFYWKDELLITLHQKFKLLYRK